MESTELKCKHCGSTLKQVKMPPESDWNVPYQMICMNDECGYYQRGWDWMRQNYKVKASYRYRYNTFNGEDGPIPVFSPMDLKDLVVD